MAQKPKKPSSPFAVLKDVELAPPKPAKAAPAAGQGKRSASSQASAKSSSTQPASAPAAVDPAQRARDYDERMAIRRAYAGVQRMNELGQDDKLAWALIPLLGFTLAAAMLAAIVYGLTPDEKWDARHNPGSAVHDTRWAPILGVIVALMLGAAGPATRTRAALLSGRIRPSFFKSVMASSAAVRAVA